MAVWLSIIALTAAGGPTPRVTRLDNRLTAVIVEDHALPLVSVQLWYRVGSADDGPQQRGLCHVARTILEQRDGLASWLREAGIRFESRTLPDACYFHWLLPPDFLECVLKAEARRMQPLSVTPALPARGLEQAARACGQEPPALDRDTERSLLAAMFPDHPYGHPPGFVAESLQNLSATRVSEFLERRLVPSNATLVVVGDVSQTETLELMRKHFADLPWAEPARRTEVPSPKAEQVRLTIPSDRAGLDLAWLTPAAGRFENAVIDVLMHRLCNPVDGPLASRLKELDCTPPRWHREGWREHGWLVLSIDRSGGATERRNDEGAGGHEGTNGQRDERTKQRADGGGQAWGEQVERAVREELARAESELPTEIEFNRARALARRDLLLRRAAFADRALELGWYQLVAGDVLLADFAEPQIASVTASDLRQAAAALGAARIVTAPRVVAEDRGGGTGSHDERIAPLAPAPLPEPATAPIAKPDADGCEIAQIEARRPAGAIVRKRLAGGVEVTVCPIPGLPLADVRTVATWTTGSVPAAFWQLPEPGTSRHTAKQIRDYLCYHGLDLTIRRGLGECESAVLVSQGAGRHAAQMIELQAELLRAACGDRSSQDDRSGPHAVRLIVVGAVDQGVVLEGARLAWGDWTLPQAPAERDASQRELAGMEVDEPRPCALWRTWRPCVERLLRLDSAAGIADCLERGVQDPWALPGNPGRQGLSIFIRRVG